MRGCYEGVCYEEIVERVCITSSIYFFTTRGMFIRVTETRCAAGGALACDSYSRGGYEGECCERVYERGVVRGSVLRGGVMKGCVLRGYVIRGYVVRGCVMRRCYERVCYHRIDSITLRSLVCFLGYRIWTTQSQ